VKCHVEAEKCHSHRSRHSSARKRVLQPGFDKSDDVSVCEQDGPAGAGSAWHDRGARERADGQPPAFSPRLLCVCLHLL